MNEQTEQKKSSTAGRLFRVVGLLLLLASFAVAWLVMDFQSFRDQALLQQDDGLVLEVRPGSSLRSLADRLHREGLIRHPVYLMALGRYLKLDNRIKAGEYEVPAGVTPEQFLQQLTSGKVIQHNLTLIEGETFKQMMQRINAAASLTHELSGKTDDQIMTAIGAPGVHPEGRFLPDTYHFPRGTTDTEFLKRAYQAMQEFLQAEWSKRDASVPLKTPYEALILASVVEKETGKASERPRIAGVFSRRLKKGMRLQSDPTIIYGLGENFDGDIRYRDLRTDTPYNSYTRKGLPPTPIAMPGRQAILAALHPQDDGSLFFVARGDGSHQFSKTLKAHNRAVNRYQKKRQ